MNHLGKHAMLPPISSLRCSLTTHRHKAAGLAVPKEVNVWDYDMQDILYLFRKRRLGAAETTLLQASEGFIQGALFARVCFEAEALRVCHIGR